jgi:SNF2 family DNA or RNA helicase
VFVIFINNILKKFIFLLILIINTLHYIYNHLINPLLKKNELLLYLRSKTAIILNVNELPFTMDRFTSYIQRNNLQHKDYQFDGVQWCLNNELCERPPCNARGGFIADEMGLGKTILMIGTMVSNLLPHTLIVLPPVLIEQWREKIHTTTGHQPIVYHGPNKKHITLQQLQRAPIVLTSYGAITLTRLDLKCHKRTLLHQVKLLYTVALSYYLLTSHG